MDVAPREPFSDLFLVEPAVHEDDRGHFLETWQRQRYEAAGIPPDFAQDNLSRSQIGVLRGLHFQHPHAQGRLVQVVRGCVWDVAVDVRVGSPTFGRWAGIELSGENHRQLWIPEGFAHGFVALDGPVDFLYKCTAYYDPSAEHTLLWNDPEVGIAWPVDGPILSDKDRNGTTLARLREAGHLPSFGD